MPTPKTIPPLSPQLLEPTLPVGFKTADEDRPIGSKAIRNGQPVYWAGMDSGFQSAGSFQKLEKQGRLPYKIGSRRKRDDGTELFWAGRGWSWQQKGSFEKLQKEGKIIDPDAPKPGSRAAQEAQREQDAGAWKPFVQLATLLRSPDLFGGRMTLAPLNAISRLGNAIGDRVQGKPVDTSDAWLIDQRTIDNPVLSPVRLVNSNPTIRKAAELASYLRPVATALGNTGIAPLAIAPAVRALTWAYRPGMTPEQALEVTPADEAARPVAEEIGAQVYAAALTFGLAPALGVGARVATKAPLIGGIAEPRRGE